MKIDLSFMKAGRIQPSLSENIILTMIGCGGTGSWLAPSLARIAYVLREQGKEVTINFIDHDCVEPKNIPRQNFCTAEIGLNKAVTLATRFSAAWGIDINYFAEAFTATTSTMRSYKSDYLEVLIGCVDNAAARKAIHQNLQRSNAGTTWWMDCGNTEYAGQVLIGNLAAASMQWLNNEVCIGVPSPAMQCPDLLQPRPEETKRNMSCADIQLANAQSLPVNQIVAAHATDMLMRFLSGTLQRRAMYFDLTSGSARSVYCLKEKSRRKAA